MMTSPLRAPADAAACLRARVSTGALSLSPERQKRNLETARGASHVRVSHHHAGAPRVVQHVPIRTAIRGLPTGSCDPSRGFRYFCQAGGAILWDPVVPFEARRSDDVPATCPLRRCS